MLLVEHLLLLLYDSNNNNNNNKRVAMVFYIDASIFTLLIYIWNMYINK